MSVYIDNARIPYRGMLMSHMIADSLVELHVFAHLLGLKPAWFQNNKVSRPHYDVCASKRAQAIRLGAIPVTSRELVERLRAGRIPS